MLKGMSKPSPDKEIYLEKTAVPTIESWHGLTEVGPSDANWFLAKMARTTCDQYSF